MLRILGTDGQNDRMTGGDATASKNDDTVVVGGGTIL